MLDHLEAIPAPQRDALRIAFGIGAGPAPDRFLIGLAVLSLLSEVAAERPLVCVVDDEQWLDRASAQALGFVARRLVADPVGLVLATRVPGEELSGLPELAVEGLTADVIDAGHFTWEDAAAEYSTLITSWWAGGYKTATRTPAGY